jgi:uncharacterized protein YbjT (DUF2867 family)
MILVTGASGLNGSKLVARLAATGHAVRALVRRPPSADFFPAKGVEVVQGDLLDPVAMALALRGVDHAMLISSSTPDMLEVQSAFITAAKSAGVSHIVKLSGIMPELDSPFRFARMHGEIEKRLEDSGVAFTHLRAGEFMNAYFRQVPNIVGKGTLFLPMEEARIASIDVDDIVEVATKVLTDSGHEGKTYRLTGPQANSMDEIAELLTNATGKAIRYVNISPEDASRAQLAAGFPPYLVDALAELFAERRRGKESHVYDDAAVILGRPAKDFGAFAARNASIFRGETTVPPKV